MVILSLVTDDLQMFIEMQLSLNKIILYLSNQAFYTCMQYK